MPGLDVRQYFIKPNLLVLFTVFFIKRKYSLSRTIWRDDVWILDFKTVQMIFNYILYIIRNILIENYFWYRCFYQFILYDLIRKIHFIFLLDHYTIYFNFLSLWSLIQLRKVFSMFLFICIFNDSYVFYWPFE